MILSFNSKIDKDYKNLYNDLIKFTTMFLVVNLLMFISNPNKNVFLGENYVKLMTYILLGLVTYWLVISKVILFD
jgi:hypothetical protein